MLEVAEIPTFTVEEAGIEDETIAGGVVSNLFLLQKEVHNIGQQISNGL